MVAAAEVTTNAPTCVPTGAAGTAVTVSNVSWGNGAWNQLVASSGAAWSVIGFDFIATSSEVEFDLGVGGSGAEVVFVRRDAKQDDRRDVERRRFSRFHHGCVDR